MPLFQFDSSIVFLDFLLPPKSGLIRISFSLFNPPENITPLGELLSLTALSLESLYRCETFWLSKLGRALKAIRFDRCGAWEKFKLIVRDLVLNRDARLLNLLGYELRRFAFI